MVNFNKINSELIAIPYVKECHVSQKENTFRYRFPEPD